MTIRSKHNDLLNYFIHDKQDLSPAYVRSAPSSKPRPALKRTQLNNINKTERKGKQCKKQ